MKSWSAVLVLLIVIALAAPVSAQDTSTPYEVISPQTVNARECPRLNCAVVQTVAPGETVMVIDTVTGDTVRGSGEWVVVDLDGAEAYVHSSLVKEIPQSETGRDPAAQSGEVDTSDWDEVEGDGFTFLTPPGWMDLSEFLADEEFIEDIAVASGVDPDDLRDQVEMLNSMGVIWIMGGFTTQLMALPMDLAGITERQAWASFRSGLRLQGIEVIDDEEIELESGDARVMRLSVKEDTPSYAAGSELTVYMLARGKRALFLVFINVGRPADAEEQDIFAGIANTVIANNANM